MSDESVEEPSAQGADGERNTPTDDGTAASRPDEEGTTAPPGARDDTPAPTGQDGAAPAGRDVVVPLRLYKTVTVFSTLIAIVAILAGFVLLDRGTQRATASPEEVSLPLVALALALIVGGSAVYAFATRFRAEGMGKPKDDTDERGDNG